MVRRLSMPAVLLAVIALTSLWAVGQEPDGRKGSDARMVRPATQRGPQGSFQTEVPSHPVDIILGRQTATSVTASVLSWQDVQGYIAYGTRGDNLSARTDNRPLTKGQPLEIVLERLKPDIQYHYELRDVGTDKALLAGAFHTQRPPGGTFTFTVQADSHLDERTNPELYRQTLANALADAPDFHIDLGDTFMTDQHGTREEAPRQYLAQRYYLGLVGRSAPVFLVLGNHDGENGGARDDGADSLAVWSNTMRKRYFPNPVPDGFYTGNATKDKFAGLLQDYYAWEWGDALFVVLDPFWYGMRQRGGSDNWTRTLGAEQYRWLARTLQDSQAKFKFVFIHNLVGGIDTQGRGGTEAAAFYEWGGKNADGSDGFKDHRPGWEMPIHQLLVRNHVTIVFHGHDHLFAKQDLDGIVYQAVPQPGFAGRGGARMAAEYGYVHGDILAGSGHLRVTVSGSAVTVDYVRALLPQDERGGQSNGTVIYTYTIPHGARPTAGP